MPVKVVAVLHLLVPGRALRKPSGVRDVNMPTASTVGGLSRHSCLNWAMNRPADFPEHLAVRSGESQTYASPLGPGSSHWNFSQL